MRKNSMLAAVLAIPLTIGMMAPVWAQDLAEKAVGVWLREKEGWLIEFSMCGERLCGEVISGEGIDKGTGKTVVGVKMLYDLKKVGRNRWKGKMYNPGDAGTYAGKVIVRSENEIKMAGCMMGIMCRSEIWQRAEMPVEMPVEMDSTDMAEDTMEMSGDE